MSAASGSSASRPSAHALHAAAASAQHTAKPVATSDRVIDIAIMVFLYFAFAYMVTCVARASQLLQLLRAMQPRVSCRCYASIVLLQTTRVPGVGCNPCNQPALAPA